MRRRAALGILLLAAVMGLAWLAMRGTQKPWYCLACPPLKPACIPYCPEDTPIIYVREPTPMGNP